VEGKTKSDTSHDWVQLRHHLSNRTGKHEIQETTKNSRTGHYTCTAGSANVKVQRIFSVRYNITYSKHCKYRTAATLHFTLETWFVSGI